MSTGTKEHVTSAGEHKASRIRYLTWPTPNALKIDIFFEELALLKSDITAERELVNIRKFEQFEPSFLAVNPNNKIPAIRDPNAIGGGSIDLFESGAILLYLAEKSGFFFEYRDRKQYYEGLKWIFWQMSGVGPMFGQAGHFLHFAPKDQKQAIEYGSKRYVEECMRLLGVLERHLASTTSGYIWNEQYSIVDMVVYPWIRAGGEEWLQLDFSSLPAVKKWLATVGARPAVKQAYAQRERIIDSVKQESKARRTVQARL